MTHREFIRENYDVIAETPNGVYFIAEGEQCCEINGASFVCNSVQAFNDMIEMFGDDNFYE